jgi:predicted esterase
MPNPAKAVLWFHGLGYTGQGWEGAFGPLTRAAKWYHPTAPVQPVNSVVHGGMEMHSWFDIRTWPISVDEPEGPAGIGASVAAAHEQLRDIESTGVPASNIMIGGFSQGGVLAILAGLSYPKKLAGICSISGWGAYRASLASHVHEENRETPLHFSVGIGDPIVSFPLTKQTGEVLQKVVGEHVRIEHVERETHPPGQEEMMSAANFICEVLDV